MNEKFPSDFDPEDTIPPQIYGSPPNDKKFSSDFDPEDTIPPRIYGPPPSDKKFSSDFDPEDNVLNPLYGPPPPSKEYYPPYFDPKDNMPPLLYGPPPPSNVQNKKKSKAKYILIAILCAIILGGAAYMLYNMFEPEINVLQTVYGPPPTSNPNTFTENY